MVRVSNGPPKLDGGEWKARLGDVETLGLWETTLVRPLEEPGMSRAWEVAMFDDIEDCGPTMSCLKEVSELEVSQSGNTSRVIPSARLYA